MWYTPISGIWQTVWLESVPQKYIRGIKITPNLEGIKLEIDGSEEQYRILIKSRKDGTEQELCTSEKSFYIKVQNPKLWTPEDPNLYDLTIEGKQDKIQSYFGLRTVGIAQDKKGLPRLLLNGKPYFFNGVLDQGYWPEGIFLPNSENGWEDDILAMKKLGFNTLRKHIKIESDFFYEACDRLGMVVFQDFVNNSDYSFFHDTVLPTLFNCHFDDHNFHKSSESRRIFKEIVTDTIKCLYNFPCVCYYTIFN